MFQGPTQVIDLNLIAKAMKARGASINSSPSFSNHAVDLFLDGRNGE